MKISVADKSISYVDFKKAVKDQFSHFHQSIVEDKIKEAYEQATGKKVKGKKHVAISSTEDK